MKQNQLSKPKNTMIRKIGKALMIPLTAGLLFLGPEAKATDSRPLQCSKRKMALAAVVAYKIYSTGRINHSSRIPILKRLKKIKDTQKAAVFKTMAGEHLKKGGKLSDLKNIAKPFNLMTEEDKATFRKIIKDVE